ncbi:hypothetical protein SPRG_00917 [Saprolegnia parasitica CBS 223.65]|uniref:Uncharacterized protein n=1 Tax=Saprolegnia parasitica (strain CBS 223.65) TaxID=695850 RepID=A0A067D773_SAPPC|nr:hypothetical protein SPRG_00917 [Saprolegnia parasitica CBS 223.65]KDO34857.1 hypothetical protein SPRG_00917 [Saprolegnia parasitica CBS 223.65]|eukprot:XP_012194519.1 hypothetical protein SPRG_00917 [Saprolegnia parasitica CBS 223.65]
MTSWLCEPRWAHEALQALSRRDAPRLRAALQLPSANAHAIVTQRPGGAPFDFAGEGFYDALAEKWASPLFKHAIDGDTLLHLALRQHDPVCARVLLDAGAALETVNSAKETPVAMLWAVHMEPTAPHAASYADLLEHTKLQLQQYQEANAARARDGLVAVYTRYAPDRLGKIELQLREFYGRELDLLARVLEKYHTSS